MLRPAYSASKAALEMLIKELALELAPLNIRVNGIAPGAIDIWGLENIGSRHVPLGRLGIPEEIGRSMVFLVEQPYITGEILTVDGGFCLPHTRYWVKQGIL